MINDIIEKNDMHFLPREIFYSYSNYSVNITLCEINDLSLPHLSMPDKEQFYSQDIHFFQNLKTHFMNKKVAPSPPLH